MITAIGANPGILTGMETPNVTRPGGAAAEAEAAGGVDFGKAIARAVDHTEQYQAGADAKVYGVASGQDQDYAGMMVALEEANISLRAMGSVRDKFVEAYQAIWNMPV
jgi:flagellar hook-basal body complex protein FliE